MSGLTHLDTAGAAHMVDVSAKQPTAREAVAEGHIAMSAEALAAVRAVPRPRATCLPSRASPASWRPSAPAT